MSKPHTPPLTQTSDHKLSLIFASVIFSFSTISNSADLTAINSGFVNGHGNAILSGNSYGTYENINIAIGGTPDSLWSSTTEAIIVGDGHTLKATKSVIIENTTKHDTLDNNGGIRIQGGSTVDFSNLDIVRIVSLGGNHSDNESSAITINSIFNSNSIDISGKIVQIIGAIEFQNILGSATANITLDGKESFWFGSLVNNSFGNSSLNLSLNNGATWIYDADNKSGQSQEGHLPSIELSGGQILLSDSRIFEIYRSTIINNNLGEDFTLGDFRDADSHYTHVTLDEVSGTGGTFIIDLDWKTSQGQKTFAQDGTSDFIEIGTVQDGSVQNIVFDQSKAHLEDMNIGDKLYFASVENGDTTFATNADGEYNSASELYTFNFETMKEWSGEDSLTYWYLTKSLGKTNENVTLLKDATLISYSLATDLDRFHERRGEARYANGTSDGLWVRYRFSNIGFDNAFDMDKNMFQIGFDRDVSTSGSRKIVGVAFDYTQANTDLLGFTGSGDNERYGLNFYYTLLADCGGYADFTAKIGRIGNDYGAQNSNGANIGADFWQTYYGIGAEFGYKYEFKSNVFIEPQAQLQIVHIEDARFTSNSGIEADIDNMNSIIGRLGFRAGYSFNSVAENQKNTVYLLADVMHEFDGDSNIYAIGASMPYSDDSSGSNTWYDVGIGTNLMLSNNSKLWLDTKHIFGGIYNSSWQINAGINITF